ncbi:MAG: trypsin-like peptidase domain-containing protein [Clostridia bacterium]|nr:trypsin-like peptidase domain-containing protein [Clostridia bacterium]
MQEYNENKEREAQLSEPEQPEPQEHSVEYQGAPEPEMPSPAVQLDLQPKKPKYKNDGLRVFLILLSVFLAITVLVSAGYFIVQRASGNKTGTLNTDLADRPSGQTTAAQQIYTDNAASVVGILVYNTSGNTTPAQASGVVYSDDGYIVTNDHIYADIAKPKFKIRTADGKIYDATYVAGDARSDLAVLKTDAPNLKKATFSKTEDLLVGESVITIGYPAGIYEKSIMTSGTISSVGRRITSSTTSYSIRLIQTDAAINPGNSGGALLNMYGQVVGITSSKLVGSTYDRIGFAIPADTVVKIADSLINNGHVEGRARLGITYTEVDLVTAERNQCPTGLLVASISEESDLYGKNIAAGDIITHINDTEITNSIDALDIIDASKPGDMIQLTVYKIQSGTSITVSATMLNDAGTSSYTELETSGGTTDSNSNNNNGAFDFPFGE